MARTAKLNAGVIGLGIIGSRAATNLRRAGYQTWVWNRTPRPEPNFLSSAAEVADAARVIQIFVSDGPALLETVQSMAPALGPEHIVINHTTTSPTETVAASRIVGERNAHYLDAPFTGSRDAAAAGDLVFFIGGESATLEKVRPQLEVNAREILPIGEIGQAAAMKIATNLMAAVMVGSLAEALCLLERYGIPLHKIGEVLPYHAVNSPLVEMKISGMIVDDFDPRFSLKHMFKDVQIALAMAQEYGVDLPETAAYAGAAMSGLQKGWGEMDFSSVAKHYGFPRETNELPEGMRKNDSPPATDEEEKKKRFSLFGRKE